MKKILDAIQIHKKKFSFDFCDNIKKYADIVCKHKGQTIKPEDDLSREVLVYGLADNKQDNLYKSFIFSNISNVLKQYIKTFKMITKADADEYFESGKLPKNATKTNIRKRALADEDIAEYLLLTI